MKGRSRRSVLRAGLFAGVSLLSGCSGHRKDRNSYSDSQDWRFYRHDTHNSNSTTAQGPKSNPEIVWQRQLLEKRRWGYWYPSPVVTDSVLYVGGDGLFALDAQTGAEKWQTGIKTSMFGPAIVDGTLYVGGNDGNQGFVQAHAASDGAVKWKTVVPHPSPKFRPIMVFGDMVFAPVNTKANQDSPNSTPSVLVLDRRNGVTTTSIPTRSKYTVTPAVSSKRIISNGPGAVEVQALSQECRFICEIFHDSMQRSWKNNLVHPWQVPVIDKDRIYVGGRDELPPSRGGSKSVKMKIIDQSNGNVLSSKKLGFTVTSPTIDGSSAFIASMRVNGKEQGNEYGTDTFVHRLTKGGKEKWRTRLKERRIFEAPIFADGVLYLATFPSQTASTPHRIHAIEARSGEILWEVNLPASACTLAVADGRIHAVGWEGVLVTLA